MARRVKELSAFQVRRLNRPGMHSVGGVTGLYLQVKPPNRRSWILRATVGSRRRDIGLGPYPTVSLEQARERAREARDLIWRGIDPIEARKAAQDALKADAAKRLTFDEATVQCWRTRAREFRNPKHARQWLSSVQRYAGPVIGSLPVEQVELAHIVKVLEPHWLTKTETMSRVRGRIETVLEWARVAGYRDGENPASWTTLKHLLPTPSKVKQVRHHAAVPWAEMPRFMADLRKRKGIAARCLEFAILTAARSGEVRFATWDEISLEAKLWTIPGERMKAGLTHKVPLSDDAVQLLEALPRHEGESHVFVAPRGGALSDMALSAVCRRMGYVDPVSGRTATPHGTARSSFKDWARSATAYPDEVSELALAHVSDDKTRAAYARDELLPRRTRLMRDWARYLASVPSKASVTAIRAVGVPDE